MMACLMADFYLCDSHALADGYLFIWTTFLYIHWLELV